ncbi:hypothetical protein ACEE78_12165 [Staphylococcus hyicus]
MINRETLLNTLYHEDILSIAKDLPIGQLELFKPLNEFFEHKYRKGLNSHGVNGPGPENFF